MKRILPYLLMGVAVIATTLWVFYAENLASDESLRIAVDDIEADCDDQLSLLLHVDAGAFVDAMTANHQFTEEQLRKLSEFLSIDEITVVDASGRITMTTAPGAAVGQQFFTDECRQRPYRNLLLGRNQIVRQRFRPSTTQADRLMKYFAMVLPQGGFLQIGYTWDTFEREFPRFFLSIFEQRQVGETGFCVVLGPDLRVEVDVPGHPEARGLTVREIGLSEERLAAPSGQVFFARILGTWCRCMFYEDEIDHRRVLAVIPILEHLGVALAISVGIAIVLFAAFLIFRLVLRKFRQQQAKIDALRAAEDRRRAEDIALARAIQLAELRTDGTDGDGYRITTLIHAAREVGGDFYDYYELPDGRLVLTMADVSGKGVPAAFFMMKARLTLKSCVYATDTLCAAIAQANVRLARNNPAEMFVTVWLGVYDPRTGTLDYVSAGHNPPLVKRMSGAVEWLAVPRGAALGVFERAKYQAAQTALAIGDRLFLYTDGVTEAMNAAGELFGNPRLEATLQAASGPLVPAVQAAVAAFVDHAAQSDDITMLETERCKRGE